MKFVVEVFICIDTDLALLRLCEHSIWLVIENVRVFWVTKINGGLS